MTMLAALTGTAYGVAETLYQRTLREHLPRRPMVVDGEQIVIKRPRLLDTSVGATQVFERAECDAIRDLVEHGDHVVVIGGGYGSTTVLASRLAGPDGRVEVWEAAPEMAELTRWAIEHNETSAPISVYETPVATVTESSREQFGEPSVGRSPLHPSQVPSGDVWTMDCEGAESEILPAANLPGRVAVEVHESLTDVERVCEALGEGEIDRREKHGDADDLWIAVVDDR